MRIAWPDKYPDEDFRDGVNWSARKGSASVVATTFELLGDSDVTLTGEAVDPDNADIWTVKVEAGTPGIQEILCKGELSSGDSLEEVAEFRVFAYPE